MAALGRIEKDDEVPGLAEDEDPRIRRVYQRLRTLTIIAALTMGLGFIAVMSVIAYRLVKGPSTGANLVPRTLALPAGARVVSTQADGGRLAVTVEEHGRTVVHVFDLGSLAPTGRLEIGPAAPDAPPLR
ncbi:hypothetical protein IHQ68_03315 [Chelatococcus sambhunathii]|uniref:Uncharacterized protein n=1 Tax=Chelatococcus sambhunathii TaxID=363953 RepID=A0ABU1DC08_9HYPH|nr:DUF6476 family protein [Chelatococcus sambhunathii]MDR4305652.1 hypothetical protein [Chelatococcus sambhunathii]